MLVEVHTSGGGCQVGGVGQGGQLIAEECARDHGTSGDGLGDTHAGADAHQSQTHSTSGTPGGTSGQGGHATNDECGGQEDGGGEDVQAVVDEGGHGAALNPRGDDHTDDEHDGHGHCATEQTSHHGLLDISPLEAQQDGDGADTEDGDEEKRLNGHALPAEASHQQDD